ncbi:MAG: alkyl sulfatase C-terminal domain-containing protein [Microthrixaceae bacterium]
MRSRCAPTPTCGAAPGAEPRGRHGRFRRRPRTTRALGGELGAEPSQRSPAGRADATVSLTKAELLAAVGGYGVGEGVSVEGDEQALERLAGWLDRPDPGFAIVTP